MTPRTADAIAELDRALHRVAAAIEVDPSVRHGRRLARVIRRVAAVMYSRAMALDAPSSSRWILVGVLVVFVWLGAMLIARAIL